MTLITKAPRGTLDKLPSDTLKCRVIEENALNTAVAYGYREIRTPVFEHTELFKRSVGDTTDIVQKEMYTFDDKKGRSLTLKPEGTACVARAAIENGLFNEALPLKLCYITNCYRYEAPQSGRYREFSQFGAEVYGADTPLCDVELIALAHNIFEKLGIPANAYTIEINSIGCPECRRLYQDALKKYYEGFKDKLCGDCHERLERNPMRLLDCKNPHCGEFKSNAPVILDYNCSSCAEFFTGVKAGLDALSIPYKVNARIVRGLDYYTNTVFEFIYRDSSKSTDESFGLVFGAGGRYNGLIKELGGSDTAASGFALGIERLTTVIDKTGVFPLPQKPDIYIATIGERAAIFALKTAQELRRREPSIWAECDIVGRSVKAQMRFADKIGARFSMVIGDNELDNGTAVLKNMATKENKEIDLSNIDSFIG
ncbi:MAG: histidine--tRNA ligase [Oscillospiraceae bacterium]|nr:histidine--tRNA ligase [Oscillospiraceae bacterium]